MAELELWCAVYGRGDVFSVTIPRDANVQALQTAIATSDRLRGVVPFPMQLYVARKTNGAWLADDDEADALLRGEIDTQYQKMRSTRKLTQSALLGSDFHAEDGQIHVLVELRATASAQEASQSMQAAIKDFSTTFACESPQDKLKFMRHLAAHAHEVAMFLELEDEVKREFVRQILCCF